MENKRFIACMHHPEKIGKDELSQLDEWIHQYPYFQAARIVYLKALYLQGEQNFRQELKTNTVHITDHKQLLRYLNGQINFESENTGEESFSIRQNFPLMGSNFCTEEAPATVEKQKPAPRATQETPTSKPTEKVLCMEVNLDDEPEAKPIITQPEVTDKQEEYALETPEMLSGMYQLTEEEPEEKPTGKKRKQKDDLIEQWECRRERSILISG